MKFLPLLIFLFALSLDVFAQTQDQTAIQDVFSKYKTAILTDKGDEAVTYINGKTVAYYSQILSQVKTADSATVEKLPILDKIMVFAIRHKASKSDILSFDGKSLLVYAIQNGMVGKESVASNSIGDVTVNSNIAKGQMMVNGRKAPLFMEFTKEENMWKMDLTSLFDVSNSAFKEVVSRSGQGENEFLFSILTMLTGKKPGAEIWKAVR